MQLLPFRIAIAIMLTAISSEARWPDRLYPFRELTDEMVAQIDLKDGSIEDWLEVLGEPTLTDWISRATRTIPPRMTAASGWLGTRPPTACT